MRILKKIPGIFLNIIMIVVFIIMLIAGYCFLQVNVFNKEYINVFGYSIFQIKTGSMEDKLKVGDIIIVDIIDSKDILKEEEIISYIEEGKIITHRIVEIDENSIITKGDANNTTDDPIERKQVIGKVIKTIPNVQIWTQVLKTKEVYTMIIITIVLFVVTFSINTEKVEKYNKTKKTKAEKNVEDNNEEEKK